MKITRTYFRGVNRKIKTGDNLQEIVVTPLLQDITLTIQSVVVSVFYMIIIKIILKD